MGYIIFRNCRVVDGTGAPAIDDAALVVDRVGGGIVFVGPEAKWSQSARERRGLELDLQGNTVVPGLFNCHTHLALELPFTPYKADPHTPGYWAAISYRRALEALASGTTSARCVGGPYGVDLAIRNAINNHMLWGPRLIVAGGLLIAHGGHGYNSVGAIQCSGVAQFREAARNQIKEGADLIKICLSGGLGTPGEGFSDKQMTNDEVVAVTEVAHMAGKKVASHTGGDKPIQDAVRLGVDCIEHGYVIEAETARIMADAGTWFVPTLAVTHAFGYLEAHGSPAYHVNKAREAAKYHLEGVARTVKEGVRIAVGTDLLPSDPLDGTNATVREMELLVEAGMTPLEAITAATLNSAMLCGVHDVTGSLTLSKQADLLVVEGKPDQHISDMRRLLAVAKAGSFVWSKIPGDEQEPYSKLPHGLTFDGGTFRRW